MKNLHSIYLNIKLNNKFAGPFTILDIIEIQAYYLQLLSLYRIIHPVFHISLLEPYYYWEGKESLFYLIIIEEEEEYQIEIIHADWICYQKQ